VEVFVDDTCIEVASVVVKFFAVGLTFVTVSFDAVGVFIAIIVVVELLGGDERIVVVGKFSRI